MMLGRLEFPWISERKHGEKILFQPSLETKEMIEQTLLREATPTS